MAPGLLKEFFRVAAVFLECRWHLVNTNPNDPLYIFVGEMDYTTEMHLILMEIKDGSTQNE